MNIQIFRRRRHQYTFKKRMERRIETSLKCLALLIAPVIPAGIVSILWYKELYCKQLFFTEKMEGIITAAWIPTFGILYSILAAIILSTVWGEYKAMRSAIKRYDLDAFIDLRDEEMSPLVYTMMIVLSSAVLLSFMSLQYPSARAGLVLISSTSYLFSLLYMVIREIDDPCGGIWFIRSVPPEWLEINVKVWRAERHEKARKEYEARLKKNGVHLKA